VAGSALAALAVLGASAGPASADPLVGSMGEGQSAFWAGAFVASARVDDPSLCGIEGPCFNYKVRVLAQHAKVLRAALDSADDSNGWGLRLLDPSGKEVSSGSTYTLHGVAENFDAEVWAHNPVPGTWTVQVIPENVQTGDFQARAAVDPTTTAPVPAAVHRSSSKKSRACRPKRARHHRARICARRSRHRARPQTHVNDMPPDLAADPPWHLTFRQPLPMAVVEGGNFTALAGAHNTDTTVAGQQTYGCLPEETVEQGAHRCLRFTSGFASLGPGKFEVYGSSTTPVATDGGPLYQVVYRSDGSSYSRRAGAFAFHKIHGHYHVLGIANFQLYAVHGPSTLAPAGTVLKEGFCLGNIKMFDWHAFSQAEIDPASVDNCEPAPQPDGTYRFYEGIANGWEDSYKWQTSGQFANFDNNPDGYYVLRVTVNPLHLLLESDAAHPANDVAYTYFQVTGNDVRVIERGHGADPWDPHKTVVDPVISH
jgi:hypothetical protein